MSAIREIVKWDSHTRAHATSITALLRVVSVGAGEEGSYMNLRRALSPRASISDYFLRRREAAAAPACANVYNIHLRGQRRFTGGALVLLPPARFDKGNEVRARGPLSPVIFFLCWMCACGLIREERGNGGR